MRISRVDGREGSPKKSGPAGWINGDHAIFIGGAVLALSHLLDELLTIPFPPEEHYRQLFFVALTAAALVAYPKLGLAKGPVMVVFGTGWAYGGFVLHITKLMLGRVGPGDLTGIAEFAAGLLVLLPGLLLTRQVAADQLARRRSPSR